MNGKTAAECALLLLLLYFSSFFSSAETALTSVNRIRIRTLAEQGNRRAAALLGIFETPEKMLSVILIGNNLVNIYASSLATTLTLRIFGSRAVGIATGLLTLAILVFGELAPKTLATRDAERVALRYAGIIRGMMTVLTPVVFLVNLLTGAYLKLLHADGTGKKEVLTEEELRTIVQVGHEEGVLQNEEREMIDNVLDFGGTQARDIMIPRIDMVWVDEQAGYEELLTLFRKEKYTRIPVCRGSADTVTGIINIKDLLLRDPEKEFRIRDFMREPLFTFEQKRTAELMVEMRKNCTNMAIVQDDYGITAGMVTMEDILEELVGEIRDEYDTDEEKPVRKTGDNTWVMDGNLRLDDLNSALGLKLASEDYESAGGYVMGLLGHLPEPGETVADGNLLFRVEKMDRKRITQLRLTIPEPQGEKIRCQSSGGML